MAEATRGSRRGKRKKKARRGRSGGSAFENVGREVAGVALVGLALLAGIALWTFDPADPVGVWEPVRNGGGVAGATVAGLLIRAMGAGALVPVLGMLVLGLRLMLPGTIQLPPKRFWVGALLLLVSLAALPELLESLAPHLAVASGGWLGETLAPVERMLLSGPGALALNSLAFLVGALGVAGVPPGVALARLGRGAGLAAQWTGAGLGAGLAFLQEAGVRAGRQLARVPAGITVWREQRARRARRVARDEEVEIAGDAEDAIRPKGKASKAPRPSKGAAPHIVDHRDSGKHEPEQGAFTFSESTSFGPYSPPDVSEIFQEAPKGSQKFDRDSLIMNSRILTGGS